MEQLSVSILDREYRLACTEEEKPALLACARYVDDKMRTIREGGKVMGADRIAVMAALQIAHEMFTARSGDGLEMGDMRRRLRELGQLCDDALLPQERLF